MGLQGGDGIGGGIPIGAIPGANLFARNATITVGGTAQVELSKALAATAATVSVAMAEAAPAAGRRPGAQLQRGAKLDYLLHWPW